MGEDDKSMVYFPYTITPEYDTKYGLKKHDNEYTMDHDKTKDKNRFDVVDTPVYNQIKEVQAQTNDLNYKQDFEKNKGKMLGTDITPEMARAHEMEPIRNKQKYQEQAKKDLVKTHVGPDGQEIAHAVVMAHQASPIVYKDDYNKNVLGQGPANPAIAFPENDRLKKIHDQTTKPKYEKDAREMLKKNILPVDAQEFVRAKNSALNASDREYTKQQAQTVHDYRGYQTMDSRVHPDVVRGQKASDLISDKVYKEDYENSKSIVYFPYTITQEYDTKADLKHLDTVYKTEASKEKQHNKYDVTATPTYNHLKELDNEVNPTKYTEKYRENQGKMLGTDITPEMSRAKELKSITSKQLYENDAKANLVNTNIPADGQQIAHAIHMTNQASDIAYTADYKKDVLGKSTKDPAIAYPEHDRLKKIHDDTTKAHYVK